jgi:SAM-dependent methyltransferase
VPRRPIDDDLNEVGPAIPADYDTDPGRFAANQAATAAFSRRGDVHPSVAQRLASAGCDLVLDLGGGNGLLARELARFGVRTVTADRARYVRDAPGPALQADALALPFGDGVFAGAAALWMLYHLPDPRAALAEVHQALRPGGVMAASAPSRYNDPEMAAVLPRWGQPLRFDAENGPGTLAVVFREVDVVRWDEPMVHLANSEAVALFLRGRGLTEDEAEAATEKFAPPLTVTKRGMLAWARK